MDFYRAKSNEIRDRSDRADRLIKEVDRIKGLDALEYKGLLKNNGDITSSAIDGQLLREVLALGADAAIKRRMAELETTLTPAYEVVAETSA